MNPKPSLTKHQKRKIKAKGVPRDVFSYRECAWPVDPVFHSLYLTFSERWEGIKYESLKTSKFEMLALVSQSEIISLRFLTVFPFLL